MCVASDAMLCMCQHERTNSGGHAEHKWWWVGNGVDCSYSLFSFSRLMKNFQFLHCHRAIKTVIMFLSFDS